MNINSFEVPNFDGICSICKKIGCICISYKKSMEVYKKELESFETGQIFENRQVFGMNDDLYKISAGLEENIRLINKLNFYLVGLKVIKIHHEKKTQEMIKIIIDHVLLLIKTLENAKDINLSLLVTKREELKKF